MEVSRLTFSKGFNKQVKKPLSYKELGELRMRKLKEKEADGSLAMCKTRDDVIRMMGFTEEQTGKGNSWIGRLISLGRVQEVLISAKGKKAEYEYHVPEKPIAPVKTKNTGGVEKSVTVAEPVAPTSVSEPAPAVAEPVVTTAPDGSKNISITLTINLNGIA